MWRRGTGGVFVVERAIGIERVIALALARFAQTLGRVPATAAATRPRGRVGDACGMVAEPEDDHELSTSESH